MNSNPVGRFGMRGRRSPILPVVLLSAGSLITFGVLASLGGGPATPAPSPGPTPGPLPADPPTPDPLPADPTPAPDPTPPKPAPPVTPTPPADPVPQPVPPGPVPAPTPDASRYPGIDLVDLRSKAPPSQIMRIRSLEEVTAVVLHQTGFQWKPDNPKWSEVKAHFVVRRDGSVVINYDPEKRMTTGSNLANRFCITIEHEGNYANANGNFWSPEKFGRSYLKDAPALVAAARQLLRDLRGFCPKLTAVFAHCQWNSNKSNCCGPELWQAIGEWSKAELGFKDGGPGWHYDGGLAIPSSWRGTFA